MVIPGQEAFGPQRLAGREHRRSGRRQVAPVRIAVVDQVVHEEPGDVIEHERGEDLVRAQVGAQQSRNRRPEHPGESAADDHGDYEQRPWPVAEHEPGRRSPDRPHVQLALTTDVVRPHPEGEGGTQDR